ncbi:unnamed protein product [Parnassius apollo]|uniref:(apollo) hypothetical protein n=1 Tax=Parnassius apollo TaxID=110799 RepID=A0A8S3YBL6_PARAO|nr:unnamed protein product [Parnassius apollo]
MSDNGKGNVVEAENLQEAGILEADIGANFDKQLATIDPHLKIENDPLAHRDLRPEMMFIREELRQAKCQTLAIVLSHSRNISKTKPYTFLQPWLGTGLLTSTGSKWHQRRKILTPTFHFNILKNFSKVFEKKSRNLVHRLKQMSEGYVDVFAVISDFTLYTICETAMGTQLDFDKSRSSVEYIESIKQIGNHFVKRLTKFWLHPDLVFYQTTVGKQFVKCLNIVHSFADNVIMERKKKQINHEDCLLIQNFDNDAEQGTKKRPAFLDLLIEAENKGEINVEGIREEVNTFMFEEKIYEECKTIFGDTDRTPSWSDLTEMKYLEATVKEILRLYPSVPFIGRKITEDFMLGDVLVKKGVEVLVHIYNVHRREDIYPEAEAFKPERFLSGEVRHPYAFIPFSAGPRNCIGQRFAIQEMKCALSEICRHFKLVPKTKGAIPTLKFDIVLRSVDPIYVKFVLR